jgi:hypothetical protein
VLMRLSLPRAVAARFCSYSTRFHC